MKSKSAFFWTNSIRGKQRRFCLAILVSLATMGAVGCEESQTAANSKAPPTTTAEGGTSDRLHEVLQLAETDMDAAIEQFATNPPDNWVAASGLDDFQWTEDEFIKSPDRQQLNQRFIERVGEIKTFSRAVVAKAKEKATFGDSETAQAYVREVNRLGEHMRDADLVLIYRQVGKALAQISLED